MYIPAKPFKILVAAPFCGTLDSKETGAAVSTHVTIDKHSLERAFQAFRPMFFKRMSTRLLDEVEIQIEFSSLKEFRPGGLLERCPFLHESARALEFLRQPDTRDMPLPMLKSRILEEWPFLRLNFDFLGEEGKETANQSVSSIVDDILSKISIPEAKATGDRSRPSAQNRQASLGRQVQDIMREVMETIYSDPDFMQMEECWQGLWFMVKRGRWDDSFSMDLLPATRHNLLQSLESYFSGCLPENLPDLVLVDSPLDASPHALDLLGKLAGTSGANLTPLAVSLEPGFFHVDSHEAIIKKLPFLPNYLQEQPYAKWQHLRRRQSSRWLMALFNRFLLREPYDSVRGLPGAVMGKHHLWGDPVWVLGALCGRSIHAFGWPTCFSRHGIIYIDDAPLRADAMNRFLPTRIHLDADRLDQMARCGISPLSSLYNDDSLFLPVDSSVSGHSMAYQLMLSMISHFVIQLTERIEEQAVEQGPMESRQVEQEVKQAMMSFLEHRELHRNFKLAIKAKDDGTGSTYVSMEIGPPPDLLLSPEPIVLDFSIQYSPDGQRMA